MKTRWLILALAVALSGNSGCSGAKKTAGATIEAEQGVAVPLVPLPNAEGSLKFVVLGDWGTGNRPQYDLANTMARFHNEFKFTMVVTVGDNLYGMQRPQDYRTKFEVPYRSLLNSGVKFYAALGNHDSREQPNYKLFNMNGEFYYTIEFKDQSVRFFMLDSTYPSPEQMEWVTNELKNSNENWKIPVFHHPLYSSGGRHGSDLKLREALEPLFVENNVSVVFAGHDHFYERIKPQLGIVHFVVGAGGKVASGDINPESGLTDKGVDTVHTFLAVEIQGDKMYFQAIATSGKVVDSGIIERRMPVEEKEAQGALAPSTQTNPRQ